MKKTKKPKIGLALGSGGGRGLAHIGVLKVLEKYNIPIDFIAGSSIGSLMGALYSVKRDIKWIEDIALTTDWHRLFSLYDFSFKQGLISGERVISFIEDKIGKINFKDLSTPLSIVATDLKNGQSICIKNGDLSSAIRASISVPLVFKPIKREGRILLDGGLSRPVPVREVREMGADIVIAVNLDADFFNYGEEEDSKFGFYKIANYSIDFLRHHLAISDAERADIIVAPKVGRVSLSDFLQGRNTIAEGEKAMKKMMPKLLKLLNREK